MESTCKLCQRRRPIYAKGCCRTCYNARWVEQFRARPDYGQRRQEYDARYRLKITIIEFEEVILPHLKTRPE